MKDEVSSAQAALVKPGISGNLELSFSFCNNLRSSVNWQGVVCRF